MKISINKVLFIPINCSYEIVFTLFANKLLTLRHVWSKQLQSKREAGTGNDRI